MPVQTAYSELLEQLLALEARRSIGHAKGTFVKKQLKGREYLYFQFSAPGGKLEQTYLGPRSPALDAVAERWRRERDLVAPDRAQIDGIAALLRAGGASLTDGASARVLGALADAGVFRLGGVLVGTQAFVVLGNVLGVKWRGAHARTDDIDIAAPKALEVAVPNAKAEVPKALESLEMGFLPVPGFDPRAPSTSYKVRGRGLRVDLLTPASSGTKAAAPVILSRFAAAATPLPYLDYLLDEAQPAAVIDGGAVLVNVPSPARFALHKLLVAGSRPSAFQTKADKDLAQTSLLVEVLEADRPGDLRRAWQAMRGRGWSKRVHVGANVLRRRAPAAWEMLAPILE